MAALLFEAWWVTIAVLLTLFAITGVVVLVVVGVMEDDDEADGRNELPSP
jgi:hypothetical protein